MCIRDSVCAARDCCTECSHARASLRGRQWHLHTTCASRELRSMTAAPCLAWPSDARCHSERAKGQDE
eukprot:13374441-Alexandrium_andersonii.AAC.1